MNLQDANSNSDQPLKVDQSNLDPDTGSDSKMMAPDKFVQMAFWLQGTLAAIGIFVAWRFNFCDRAHDLLDFDWSTRIAPALLWGTLGTLPMLILLPPIYFGIGPFKSMQKLTHDLLHPLFKNLTWIQILVISILAGVSEEILFRWCLQGGLAEVINHESSWLFALLIASVLFGAAHFVTVEYFLLTFGLGIYLGWMMLAAGTFYAPVIAHALYDFIAIVFIARVMKPEVGLPAADQT